jgi:superoxide dismutase
METTHSRRHVLRYVDAFMQNVHWDEVSRRVEWARRALRA